MKVGNREIINQSHAARIKGVSRQRINELVSKGRFSVPEDADGNLMKGTVYLDEVLNLERGQRGRPRKSQTEWFIAGETVLWNFSPRSSYGYSLPIVAKIVKTSTKKIQLEFTGGDGEQHFAWANRTDCEILEKAAPIEMAEVIRRW
jgi:hypothetical protein